MTRLVLMLSASVIIRHKQTGETVKYSVAESWLAKLADWNKTLDPHGRYEQVMQAEGLFEVAPAR